MTYSEYSFPNDTHIFWSLMIVTYPFLTGLIAGAFTASALYHVFNRKELLPVNRFALLLSFALMVCAPLPLLLHLGHPERALNVIVTPHFRSAIAGFGFVYSFYFIVLAFEIWLSYREGIIQNYKKSIGFTRHFWSILALGVYDNSKQSLCADRKLIHILSIIGIPAAFTLHGYVGFLFGSLKSNPWWSTPLMPQVFLLSAIISGLALLILIYLYLGYIGVLQRSYECLKSLCLFLWFTMLLYMLSEGLEMLYFFYESSDAWFAISKLIATKLWLSFVILQIGIGVIVPFTILTIMLFFRKKEHFFASLAGISSALLLFEVWMMRWNIVIGGQLVSKSFVGFREYHPQWFEKEGIITTIIMTLLPLLVLYLFSRFVPLKSIPLESDPHSSTPPGSK